MALSGMVQLENLSSDPGSPVAGQMYFNTTVNKVKMYDGSTWNLLPPENPTRPPDIASNIHFWDLTGVISTRTTTSVTDEGLAGNGNDLATYSGTITTASVGSQGRTGIAFQGGNTGQMENASARPWSGQVDGTLMAVLYNFARISTTVYSHVMHMGLGSANNAMGIAYYGTSDAWGVHRWNGNEPNASDGGLIEGVNNQLMVLFTRYDASANTANFRAYVNGASTPNINTSSTVSGGINIGYGDGVKVSSRVGGVDVEPGQFNGCAIATFNSYLTDADCNALAVTAYSDYS